MLHSFRATGFGVVAVLCLATPSLAQDVGDRFGVLISTGWSTLHTDGNTVLDNEDGWYLDTEFMWHLQPDKPLWAGIGFAGSYYEASRSVDLSGGLFAPELDLSADLGLFAIEPRLTYVLMPRQKDDRGLFLAGRLGIGLLIADQSTFGVIETGNVVTFGGDSETTVAFEVRPAVQIGYSGGHWQVGGEFSYMWAWGDFDAINSDQLEEAHAGVFFRFTY